MDPISSASLGGITPKPVEQVEEDKIGPIGRNTLGRQEASPTFRFRAQKEGVQKLTEVKTALLALPIMHPKHKEVISKAMGFMGPILEVSHEAREVFTHNMGSILADKEMVPEFAAFIKECENARDETVLLLKNPQRKHNPKVYQKLEELQVELNTKCLEKENNELLQFILSFAQLSYGKNTQMYTDYLINPAVSRESALYVPPRVGEQRDLKKLSTEEKILTGLSYYGPRYHEWGAHNAFTIIERNALGAPRVVTYKIGSCIPGLSLFETEVKLNLRKQINDSVTPGEAIQIFQQFKNAACNEPAYRKGEFSELLGKEGRWGEMDRKIAACIVGITLPGLKKELIDKGIVEDKTETYFNPNIIACVEDLVLFIKPEELNRAIRLLQLISPDESNRDTFSLLHEAVTDLEAVTGLEILSQRVLQDLNVLINDFENREILLKFIDAFEIAEKEPNEENLVDFNVRKVDLLELTTARDLEGLTRFVREVSKSGK